jgi:RNA polymerase sigma-70 factor (ECF subfamily)
MFARLADGDASSLETLYRMAAGQIFGLALWRTGSVEDAGDVVQEVFLRLLGQSRRLGSVGNPRSWLLSLAHHVAVDTVRRRRTAVPIEEAPYLVAPEHDAARAVDASRVARHLAGLPAAQREAVYLRHYADCTFAEIGAVMKVPTFTAASRYRLGVERLRKLLEGTP